MRKHPRLLFVIKCVFASCFFMFLSMAAGELIIDRDLFHNFLDDPKIWPLIMLETALPMLVLSLVGLFVLSVLPFKNQKSFRIGVVGVWVVLFVLAAYASGVFFRSGHLTTVFRRPFFLFGWTIPGALIFAAYISFSWDLWRNPHPRRLSA